MTIPEQLITALRAMEGVEHEAYQDSLGNWTIGVGHLGAYPGEVWTDSQINAALTEDVTKAAWWQSLLPRLRWTASWRPQEWRGWSFQ